MPVGSVAKPWTLSQNHIFKNIKQDMLKDMLKTVFQDTCTSELETIQMASVGRWLNKLGTCLPWNTTQEQKGTNYYLHNNLD